MPFTEIIGQPKAISLLSRAVAGDRLAHGYLFTGPEGVGKGTTAHALAGWLFCQAEEGDRPCGSCPGCLKYSSGNHPDYVQVRPDGAAIKIAQIRELKKSVTFAPFEAGLRVVVIEDVQTMAREAANSLLKLLEEPPPNNLLLLIASGSAALLDTIVSRCQVIPFVPLNMGQAADVIGRLHPKMAPDELHSLARLTGGCPGQVDSLYSEMVLQFHKSCIAALLRENRSQAEAVEEALYLARQMAELKHGLNPLFDLLAIFFKEVMISLLCNREQPANRELTAARERWSLQQLSDMIESINGAHHDLARNCNRALVCEVLLLELFV
jgi:DNA polymerase-3 subunit delta'